MNLSSKIEVTLSCGRVINLENTLTYTGVSEITKLLSTRRTNLNFTHLYVRYASTKSDANDVSTSFNTLNDIKSTGVSDFKTTLGTAGFSIFPITSGSQILSTDLDKYECNAIRFEVSFSAADLGSNFKTTNKSNYSIIHYMGLAERPDPSSIANLVQSDYDQGEYDNILSVLRLSDTDLFGIAASGSVDVKYDLNLSL